MQYISNECNSIVYADDTNLVITGKNVEEAAKKANMILNKYVNYFNMNKLTLNENKTKYMVFTQSKSSSNTPVVAINDLALERVKSIKFLGVILNDRLKWDEHKIYIKTKISKNIGILNKCRKVLKLNDIISMYNSFILPYLSYCLPLWGSSDIPSNDIIKKAQNKVVRIITNTKRTHKAWDKLSDMKILPIGSLYKLEVSKLCHKHIYGKLPTLFECNVMPKLAIMVHDSNTRQTTGINYNFEPSSNLHLSNKSLTSDCVRIWNDIPYNIKKQTSQKIFAKDFAQLLANNGNV